MAENVYVWIADGLPRTGALAAWANDTRIAWTAGYDVTDPFRVSIATDGLPALIPAGLSEHSFTSDDIRFVTVTTLAGDEVSYRIDLRA